MIVNCCIFTGTPSAVIDLTVTRQNHTISLYWTAPWTLEEDPDITYCVNVVTSTSSDTFCGINETEFTYPVPPDSECYAALFTVTPVNVVGDGESQTVFYIGTETRKCYIQYQYSQYNSYSIIMFVHL